MLTARSSHDDEFSALELGADEYIRKPFDPRILMLRIKKMLGTEKVAAIRDLEIDFERKKVYKNGEELALANDIHNTLKFTISNKTTRLKEEHLAYIWDPFYVIEESRNKEISGTGLGLSIVAEILRKNELKYEATLEDSYISFSVRFEVF